MTKGLISGLLVFVVWGVVAAADEIDTPSPQEFVGDVCETAVIWFDRTSATTEMTGELSLSGSVAVGDKTVPFTTRGAVSGFGEGDTATLTGVLWAILTAGGTLESGEEIEIRGGFTIDSGDFLLTTEASGEGTGTHYLVILLPDARLEVVGAVHGIAGGTFVRPDDPSTMQLSITGTMRFEADSTTSSSGDAAIDPEILRERLPWDLDTWPQDLLGQLLRLLGEPSVEEGMFPEGGCVDPGY